MEQKFSLLVHQLKKWDHRRRGRDALVWLPRGLLAGLLLAGLVVVLARFRPVLTNQEVGIAILVLAGVGLLLSLVMVLWQRLDLLQQARFADRQFALQERATTAVELQTGRLAAPPALAAQQLADTLQATATVDTRARLPLRPVRRDWLLILVALILLTAAILLPNPLEATVLHQRAVDEAIAEQEAALEALIQEIEENPNLTADQKEELQEPLEDALQILAEDGISQAEAVAVLSAAEADLRSLSENQATALLDSLNAAGQPLAQNEQGSALGQALQNGDLFQAAAEAANLAGVLPSLSAAEQAALAQDLAATAAALQDIDPELAQQLAEAAQALAAGDVAGAQQALQAAGGTLQQRGQEAAGAQQAAGTAEQLQSGAQEVAQAGQGAGTNPGQGNQPGQEGQSGSGAGAEAGQGAGSGAGQGNSGAAGVGPDTGGTGGETGHAESVYVPDFTDLGAEPGTEIELPAECLANPENCGSLLNESPTEFGEETSTIPYDQVFGDYRDAAYEALADDYIPLGLKGFIRDYFSSLEP